MNVLTWLDQFLEEHLEPQYFVVETNYSEKKPKAKLSIILDGDEGITIDKCAKVSRLLSNQLDELDLIPSGFTLEVSSPGVDKPLKLPRQFKKNQGRTLRIVQQDGEVVEGLLNSFENEVLSITQKKRGRKKEDPVEPLQIPLNEVKEAKVLISFH